jgi:hypothetical protein
MRTLRTLYALPLCFALARAGAAAPPVLGGGPERSVPLTGSLAETVKRVGTSEKGPLWLAWEVDAVPSLGNTCCFDNGFRPSVCRLEKRQNSWGGDRDHERRGGRVQVLARWAEGRIHRVRAVSDECAVDAGGLPFVHLENVPPAESVALLAGIATAGGRKGDTDEALAALAYHDGAAADATLRRLASRDERSDLREKALFWIGQSRGEEGARFLAGVARTDPDSEIREKAVFSLSQNDAPGAVPAIVEVARRDADPDVRGQALFWLAQTGAAVAPQVILESLDRDPPVREKAVFAITQLHDGQSVPLLVRLVRERRDPEVRKQALFWLGQSSDPRAFDFLEKILDP